MINVIALFTIGTFLGFLLRKRKGIIRFTDYITNWSVYTLLFLLGLSIGINTTIIKNIGTIGIQAFIFAVGAIGGSIILTFVVEKLLFKHFKK